MAATGEKPGRRGLHANELIKLTKMVSSWRKRGVLLPSALYDVEQLLKTLEPEGAGVDGQSAPGDAAGTERRKKHAAWIVKFEVPASGGSTGSTNVVGTSTSGPALQTAPSPPGGGTEAERKANMERALRELFARNVKTASAWWGSAFESGGQFRAGPEGVWSLQLDRAKEAASQRRKQGKGLLGVNRHEDDSSRHEPEPKCADGGVVDVRQDAGKVATAKREDSEDSDAHMEVDESDIDSVPSTPSTVPSEASPSPVRDSPAPETKVKADEKEAKDDNVAATVDGKDATGGVAEDEKMLESGCDSPGNTKDAKAGGLEGGEQESRSQQPSEDAGGDEDSAPSAKKQPGSPARKLSEREIERQKRESERQKREKEREEARKRKELARLRGKERGKEREAQKERERTARHNERQRIMAEQKRKKEEEAQAQKEAMEKAKEEAQRKEMAMAAEKEEREREREREREQREREREQREREREHNRPVPEATPTESADEDRRRGRDKDKGSVAPREGEEDRRRGREKEREREQDRHRENRDRRDKDKSKSKDPTVHLDTRDSHGARVARGKEETRHRHHSGEERGRGKEAGRTETSDVEAESRHPHHHPRERDGVRGWEAERADASDKDESRKRNHRDLSGSRERSRGKDRGGREEGFEEQGRDGYPEATAAGRWGEQPQYAGENRSLNSRERKLDKIERKRRRIDPEGVEGDRNRAVDQRFEHGEADNDRDHRPRKKKSKKDKKDKRDRRSDSSRPRMDSEEFSRGRKRSRDFGRVDSAADFGPPQRDEAVATRTDASRRTSDVSYRQTSMPELDGADGIDGKHSPTRQDPGPSRRDSDTSSRATLTIGRDRDERQTTRVDNDGSSGTTTSVSRQQRPGSPPRESSSDKRSRRGSGGRSLDRDGEKDIRDRDGGERQSSVGSGGPQCVATAAAAPPSVGLPGMDVYGSGTSPRASPPAELDHLLHLSGRTRNEDHSAVVHHRERDKDRESDRDRDRKRRGSRGVERGGMLSTLDAYGAMSSSVDDPSDSRRRREGGGGGVGGRDAARLQRSGPSPTRRPGAPLLSSLAAYGPSKDLEDRWSGRGGGDGGGGRGAERTGSARTEDKSRESSFRWEDPMLHRSSSSSVSAVPFVFYFCSDAMQPPAACVFRVPIVTCVFVIGQCIPGAVIRYA